MKIPSNKFPNSNDELLNFIEELRRYSTEKSYQDVLEILEKVPNSIGFPPTDDFGVILVEFGKIKKLGRFPSELRSKIKSTITKIREIL